MAYSPKVTEWQLSYDGRANEPLHLPMKFPMLLAMGVEGIAVGLSTKILPHNFNELIDASVKVLQGKPFKLVPDFPTGGQADFSTTTTAREAQECAFVLKFLNWIKILWSLLRYPQYNYPKFDRFYS